LMRSDLPNILTSKSACCWFWFCKRMQKGITAQPKDSGSP
jgi:hypothetical protein